MNRRFTNREKTLLAVLAVMLLGVLYYWAVWSPTTAALADAQSRTAEAQAELEAQQVLAQRMQTMEAALVSVRGEASPDSASVPPYDNLQNVVVLLNTTLAATDSYDLTFQPLVQQDATVQRPVSMQFTCTGYAQARAILTQLYAAPYRCTIGDFSLRAATQQASAASLTTSPVVVTASITFLEALS